jgi:hypothetical protein
VLELVRPAGWDSLSRVWQGVQADLELPAPAIAISGSDGYQLWFSFSQPVPAGRAMAFLESLRRRYLGELPQQRIRMHACDASRGDAMPPAEVAPGRWSAFVTQDLAGLFADERWLDLPPGDDAQAELLSRHQSTRPDDWARALERLGPVDTPSSARAPPAPAAAAPPGADATIGPAAASSRALDPRSFLLEVMNDPATELHLRVEAAKALLPYFEDQRPDRP